MDMRTEKLYVKSVYQREAMQKLIEIDGDRLAFESTVFFPAGGGQLCDTGTINGLDVFDVTEDKSSGLIWHRVSNPFGFEIGKEYPAKLDWDKRFNHMLLHCGEHLLSGAFLKLFGAVNKGFHMGEDYVTVDIDCPGSEITSEMARAAENLANEYVRMDIPVETHFFDTAAEAMSMPCRKAIKFGENISVVLIGDVSDPADCCACCGTHPSSTGQIGLVKITHSEKYKGMNRYYVKCGIKALEDYSNLQDIVEKVERHYSCDALGIEAAILAEGKRQEDLYRKYSMIKDHCMDLAIKEAKTSEGLELAVLNYDYFTADDLQTVARKLNPKHLMLLCSEKERCCVLVSDGSIACGQLVKEAALTYGCKGGGKAGFARAVFDSVQGLKHFVEAVKDRQFSALI